MTADRVEEEDAENPEILPADFGISQQEFDALPSGIVESGRARFVRQGRREGRLDQAGWAWCFATSTPRMNRRAGRPRLSGGKRV